MLWQRSFEPIFRIFHYVIDPGSKKVEIFLEEPLPSLFEKGGIVPAFS